LIRQKLVLAAHDRESRRSIRGRGQHEALELKLDFSIILKGSYLDMLVHGACTTIVLFALALLIALVVATTLASARASGIRFFEWLVAAYVAYHRNVPLLVQLFVWYFGIPQILPVAVQTWINTYSSEFVFALIALSFNSAAYMSEDLRSGLRAVGTGQQEAARALGLSYSQSLRDVLLPQAARIAIPPLTNQALTLFKSTSLAMAIGVAEMTYASHQIDNATFRAFEAYAIASAFYMTISLAIMGVGAWLGSQTTTSWK
jgi:polar amino acid transport system permease protein